MRKVVRRLFVCFLLIPVVLSSGQFFGQVVGKDLIPLNISISPSDEVPKGTIVTVSTTIRNQGTQTIGYPTEEITVDFHYVGAWVGRKFATITRERLMLDPGAEEVFEAKLDTLVPEEGKEEEGQEPLPAGNYRIIVTVDPERKIPDEITGNNTIRTPQAGPDLKIKDEPLKPDFVLAKIIFTPGVIIPSGEELIVAATVRNAGTQDASPGEVEFSYRLKQESAFRSLGIGTRITELRRQEEKSSFLTEDTSDWLPGVYIINAQVKPQAGQTERSQANNSFTRSLFVVDRSKIGFIYPSFSIPLVDPERLGPEQREAAREPRIGALTAGPAVARVEEGDQERTVIYFGADDGILYSLYSDGRERWKYSAQGAIKTAPVVALDRIYFGSDDGHLYAITSAGSFSWQYPPTGEIGALKAAPALLKDSSGAVLQAIYFGSDEGCLYALTPTGGLKWKFCTGAFVRTTPALATVTEAGEEKTLIFFGSGDGNLYALEDQVNRPLLRWTFPTGSFIKSSPTILNDTIYFGSSDGHLYAVLLDGTKKWQYPLEGDRPIGAVESNPLAAEDDGATAIYFGANDGILYKVEDTGREGIEQWKFEEYERNPLGPIRSSPVRRGEMVYFGSDDGILYVVSDRGSTVSDEWIFPTRGMITGTPVIDGNTLYLPSWEGHLYALKLD
ncbi:MAG: PQQ-binding-like beta-propeller repeat protein [Candidatus Acetothermia bacterium]|nr:PQQ-binding-like beta-propeller repeat protein [Candidatus Acetothermia bacterium]